MFKKTFFRVMILSAMVLSPYLHVWGAGPFADTFNSYSDGDLSAQSPWEDIGGGGFDVVSSGCYSSKCAFTVVGANILTATPTSAGTATFYVKLDDNATDNILAWVSPSSYSPQTYVTLGSSSFLQPGSYNIGETIEDGVWTKVVFSWDSATDEMCVAINDGTIHCEISTSDIDSPDSFVIVDNSGGGTGTWFDELSGESFGAADTSTRIIVTDPLHKAVTATTTDIGANVYISEEDFETGMYLNIAVTARAAEAAGGYAIDAYNSATGNLGIQIPITASGLSSLSTTTTLTYPGAHNVVWSIRTPTYFSSLPWIGTYFNPETLISTSTIFYNSWRTDFDVAFESSGTDLVDYLVTGTTTGSVLNENCGLGNFNAIACLVSLFVPTSAQLKVIIDDFRESILHKFPIGYFTRFVEIISGSTVAVEPPVMLYTFGSSSPVVLQGETVQFQIWDRTEIITQVKSDNGNRTIWEIVDPFVTMVVAFGVFFLILSEAWGIQFVTNDGKVSSSNAWVLTRKESQVIEDSYERNSKAKGIMH